LRPRLFPSTHAQFNPVAEHVAAEDVTLLDTSGVFRGNSESRFCDPQHCSAFVPSCILLALWSFLVRQQGDEMKAVILASGLGTPSAKKPILRSKPMVEIGGRPIEWTLNW
jgi:hypothetical protein